MPIAREGWSIIFVTALLGGGLAVLGWHVHPGLAIPPALLVAGVAAFFRDPQRRRTFQPGELCAPADGTVTEITELAHHETIDGPAVRIGLFLSLFNVHINRMPCGGVVRSRTYRKGEFLDARHPESGLRNESNTLVLDPDPPLSGPVVVRQVAGMVARRIVCRVGIGEHLPIGARFGLIKFGSRTELIVPRRQGTTVCVRVGDRVKAGLTVMVRQPVPEAPNRPEHEQARSPVAMETS